jgi:hypothetical protein
LNIDERHPTLPLAAPLSVRANRPPLYPKSAGVFQRFQFAKD